MVRHLRVPSQPAECGATFSSPESHSDGHTLARTPKKALTKVRTAQQHGRKQLVLEQNIHSWAENLFVTVLSVKSLLMTPLLPFMVPPQEKQMQELLARGPSRACNSISTTFACSSNTSCWQHRKLSKPGHWHVQGTPDLSDTLVGFVTQVPIEIIGYPQPSRGSTWDPRRCRPRPGPACRGPAGGSTRSGCPAGRLCSWRAQTRGRPPPATSAPSPRGTRWPPGPGCALRGARPLYIKLRRFVQHASPGPAQALRSASTGSAQRSACTIRFPPAQVADVCTNRPRVSSACATFAK